MIIAIDGPSGAGKSTISSLVAKKLGFNCLDTGAMYRAVTVFALDNGVSLDDQIKLTDIAESKAIDFSYAQDSPSPVAVFIDGRDVTKEIRESRTDKAVTPVCQVNGVRKALVEQQRRIGSSANYVVEGRDIGTVVFPHAQLKIYMTASAQARAKRRVLQNEHRGIGDTNFDKVLEDMQRRDKADENRENSPLKLAKDSIFLDTSDMTLEQVVDKICKLAQRHE